MPGEQRQTLSKSKPSNDATVYEDVIPALAELKAMGIQLFIASSLSSAAIARFLDRGRLHESSTAVWNRDNAGGIKAAPLQCALRGACLEPSQAMFLTDTAEGLKVAAERGRQLHFDDERS